MLFNVQLLELESNKRRLEKERTFAEKFLSLLEEGLIKNLNKILRVEEALYIFTP